MLNWNSVPGKQTQVCTLRDADPGMYTQGRRHRGVHSGIQTQGCILRDADPGMYTQGCTPRDADPRMQTHGCRLRDADLGMETQGCRSSDADPDCLGTSSLCLPDLRIRRVQTLEPRIQHLENLELSLSKTSNLKSNEAFSDHYFQSQD